MDKLWHEDYLINIIKMMMDCQCRSRAKPFDCVMGYVLEADFRNTITTKHKTTYCPVCPETMTVGRSSFSDFTRYNKPLNYKQHTKVASDGTFKNESFTEYKLFIFFVGHEMDFLRYIEFCVLKKDFAWRSVYIKTLNQEFQQKQNVNRIHLKTRTVICSEN